MSPGQTRWQETLERYGPHVGRVRALARRLLVDPDEASDCVQEVVLRLHGHLDQLAGRPAVEVGRWLSTVARNHCLNRIARRQPVALTSEPPAGRAPPSHAAQAELADQLEAAIARLPDAERVAVVLHHQEGLSYAEVAAALAASEGKVRSDLFRGRRRLRAWLGELL